MRDKNQPVVDIIAGDNVVMRGRAFLPTRPDQVSPNSPDRDFLDSLPSASADGDEKGAFFNVRCLDYILFNHIRNRNRQKYEMKPQEHFNHFAGRAETPYNELLILNFFVCQKETDFKLTNVYGKKY